MEEIRCNSVDEDAGSERRNPMLTVIEFQSWFFKLVRNTLVVPGYRVLCTNCGV